VRFTLHCDGPLPAACRRGVAKDKQLIRERFHPQLTELWTHEPLSSNRERDCEADTEDAKPGSDP
jgi:hypothetical protein